MRYWQAVEPIWGVVSIYDGPTVFLEQFGKVTLAQGYLFAAHWCQSEVCNGGFHQFFTNPTGVLAPEAAAGYKALGMPECARVVAEAMAFFVTPYPRGQEMRIAALRQVPGETREEWDPFYELDDRFYPLLDGENGGFEVAANEYARRTGA